MVRVSPKSSMALFLPMNILEAEVVENPKSQLWRASNFVCLSPLSGIRGDMRKNTMTIFMSEVLYRVVTEDTNETGLADWVKKEILTLDALQTDFSNFHLLFLLDLCTALGFSPSLSDLTPFAGAQLSHIQKLLERPFADALLVPLHGTDRNEIAEAIIHYISYHIEATINIRSLPILREIFG